MVVGSVVPSPHHFCHFLDIVKCVLVLNVHEIMTAGLKSTTHNNQQAIPNRGCDRMVVGYTTTYAISAYHH